MSISDRVWRIFEHAAMGFSAGAAMMITLWGIVL